VQLCIACAPYSIFSHTPATHQPEAFQDKESEASCKLAVCSSEMCGFMHPGNDLQARFTTAFIVL